MSLKKSGNVESKTPFSNVKVEKEKFPQVGSASLFGKKELKPEEKKAIVIRPLTVDGKVDWQADGYLLWFSDIDAIRKSGTFIPVYLVKYRPPE